MVNGRWVWGRKRRFSILVWSGARPSERTLQESLKKCIVNLQHGQSFRKNLKETSDPTHGNLVARLYHLLNISLRPGNGALRTELEHWVPFTCRILSLWGLLPFVSASTKGTGFNSINWYQKSSQYSQSLSLSPPPHHQIESRKLIASSNHQLAFFGYSIFLFIFFRRKETKKKSIFLLLFQFTICPYIFRLIRLIARQDGCASGKWLSLSPFFLYEESISCY